MESTQNALTQLMGFIFIVALIYLAIAFSLELIKRRAEIIYLHSRSRSTMQSEPIRASRLSAMEPNLEGMAETTAVNDSPAEAKANLANAWVKTGEAEILAEETLESLTAELDDFFASQTKPSSPKQASQSPPESAITPDKPDPEDVWAATSGAGQPSDLITAKLKGQLTAQISGSITAKPEEPSIDQSTPYFTDETEAPTVLMPAEFEEVWTIPPEATESFAELEAIFAPAGEAELLAKGTPAPIEELEELATVDLEELFASTTDFFPLGQNGSLSIAEPDGPTDDELEEIFGDKLKFESSDQVSI